MPTTRTRKRRRRDSQHRVTAAAIAAFVAGDDDALRAELGLRPWEWPTLPPLDEPSPRPANTFGGEWWPIGQALHRELIAAARDDAC